MGPLYQEIGRRLRRAREAAELSQEAVGRRVGLSRASIANIEAGRQRFAVDTVYQLANALHVDVLDLLPEGQPSHQAVPKPRRELMQSIPRAEREWLSSLFTQPPEIARKNG